MQLDELHRRLVSGDASIVDALTALLFYHVQRRLEAAFTRTDRDYILDATVDAIMEYLAEPSRFDPGRNVPLHRFLYLAARRNVVNALDAQSRRHAREHLYAVLATSRAAAAPPSGFELEQPHQERGAEEFARRVLSLANTDAERAALRCWLDGERRTMPLAAALGCGHLPIAAQRHEVKRFKDRLLKRIRRSRGV